MPAFATLSTAIAVSRRLTVTLGRLGLDALLPAAAGTLPLAPRALARPAAFNALLRDHGWQQQLQGAQAEALRVLDIKAVSSNCNNSVLAVDWDVPGRKARLPATLFLKLPCREPGTRLFCNLIDVWRLECDFLRGFARDFPLRLPRIYALATQRSRFVLLQENLGEDPTVRLHTNPDMLAGPDEATVRACLAAFARFHARYQDLPAAEREARLPLRTHPFLSPAKSGLSLLINRAAITPCQREAGDDFPPAVAALYGRALEHWDELLAWWYREPLTLIHGDSHLGNFFVSGEHMGMLDFQAAQWGKGLRDVQYFLINSVPAPTLAANEREWVRYYLDALAANGVVLDFDKAWEQYRAFSFQTLMTIVVSLGLGTLTEQEHLMAELLRRSVAAVERLDFSGWLEQLIARR